MKLTNSNNLVPIYKVSTSRWKMRRSFSRRNSKTRSKGWLNNHKISRLLRKRRNYSRRRSNNCSERNNLNQAVRKVSLKVWSSIKNIREISKPRSGCFRSWIRTWKMIKIIKCSWWVNNSTTCSITTKQKWKESSNKLTQKMMNNWLRLKNSPKQSDFYKITVCKSISNITRGWQPISKLWKTHWQLSQKSWKRPKPCIYSKRPRLD